MYHFIVPTVYISIITFPSIYQCQKFMQKTNPIDIIHYGVHTDFTCPKSVECTSMYTRRRYSVITYLYQTAKAILDFLSFFLQ